jgi:hypothetical protein
LDVAVGTKVVPRAVVGSDLGGKVS